MIVVAKGGSLKKQAILRDNFETKIKKKMVGGKEVEESVPKYKKGQRFDVFKMDLFWMSPEEKGGEGINLSVMEYLRLTYPDGTPTKYFNLFDIVGIDQQRPEDPASDE